MKEGFISWLWKKEAEILAEKNAMYIGILLAFIYCCFVKLL